MDHFYSEFWSQHNTKIYKIYSTSTTQIDPYKLGWSLSVIIMMSVNRINFESFTNNLYNEYPEMVERTRVTGKDCLIMKFHIKNGNHLEEVVNRLLRHGDPTTLLILNELLKNGSIRRSIN